MSAFACIYGGNSTFDSSLTDSWIVYSSAEKETVPRLIWDWEEIIFQDHLLIQRQLCLKGIILQTDDIVTLVTTGYYSNVCLKAFYFFPKGKKTEFKYFFFDIITVVRAKGLSSCR